MNKNIIFQAGQKIQIVKLFDPDKCIEIPYRRPWYQGRMKRTGRYTKKRCHNQQKRDRRKNFPRGYERTRCRSKYGFRN